MSSDMTDAQASAIHARITARAVAYLTKEIAAHREAELPQWGPQRWIGERIYDSLEKRVTAIAPTMVSNVLNELGAMKIDELVDMLSHA